jgi:acyl-CoA hydrolase
LPFRPISIGDVVEVRAQVVFTGSNELESRGAPLKGAAASVFQTRVDIHIIDLKTGKRNLSNEFHFTFLARETQEGEPSSHKIVPFEVRPVKPTTYSEGCVPPTTPSPPSYQIKRDG